MPNCRNCGARLSKFDKDICPVCGCEHPLKDVKSETIEITTEIDINSPEFSYKPKTRGIAFTLFAFLGWTGAGYFYLYKIKLGIIWLLANLAVFAGVGVLFALAFDFGWGWGLGISAIIIYVINSLVGLYFVFKNDLKDGRGEFIR